MPNKINDIEKIAKQLHMPVYKKDWNKNTRKRDYTPRKDLQTQSEKIVDLETAIKASGLKDGMTISFHHHFRNGDKIVNLVVAKLAEMGFKNLTLAASSLSEVHAPLIEYIKSGVITSIQTSGLRGDLADAISHGLMDKPVIFRSHGGRAAAIANDEIHIDVAFLGASSCDYLGNANGYSRSGTEKSICGSLGYAKVDAEYADKVIILTDNLVPYPNVPVAIAESEVDYIVLVDEVGETGKISSGALRQTKNPRDLLLAQIAAKVVVNSGYFYDGFSMQTGSGGASLAVTQFIREAMKENNIKARYALGGITGHMVQLHEEGLIEKLLDVQSFDIVASQSLKNNRFHQQINANVYANPFDNGSAINWLDVVLLSALEVDVNFNVNVLTGSNGIIRGAIGGHPDTSAGAALSVILCPLLRGRIPCVVDKVTTVITPGDTVDVIVTDYGVAVNPNRPDVAERLKRARINVVPISELKAIADGVIGKPDPLPFGEKIVGVVTSRDGAVLDVIHEIVEED
ncbi:MAG TPA: citrate lyase subunit alpha [Eubacteriales bacterium]|nr:citrate lyase subunit alpha [Eubacteriales bacterium]